MFGVASAVTVMLLMSTGCPQTVVAVGEALLNAIRQGQYDSFRDELTQLNGINKPCNLGHRAVLAAAAVSDARFLDALLQFELPVRNVSQDGSGNTPLHLAVAIGAVEVARLLLMYGASPDVPNASGRTARQILDEQSRPLKFELIQLIGLIELMELYDDGGAAAFEEPPGSWTRMSESEEKEKERLASTQRKRRSRLKPRRSRASVETDLYWLNTVTVEARWNTPPQCAWMLVNVQGHPVKYINGITGQTATRTPAALAWRYVRAGNEDMWYNWAANVTQFQTPAEIPSDMLEELKRQKNYRWFNERTGDMTWEDPKFHSQWREIDEEDGPGTFFYNVETAQTTYDVPEQLAWRMIENDAEVGRTYFWNFKTGESDWDPPPSLAWSLHNNDLSLRA